MITLAALTKILGWSTLINFLILIFSTLSLVLAKNKMLGIQEKISGLKKSEIELVYYQFLAFYKVLIIVFNLVPYLALRII